jgi:hypothetical protein
MLAGRVLDLEIFRKVRWMDRFIIQDVGKYFTAVAIAIEGYFWDTCLEVVRTAVADYQTVPHVQVHQFCLVFAYKLDSETWPLYNTVG